MLCRTRSRPSDLAIQWDLPAELATIEGWFPNPYGGSEPIYAATARLADWVHDNTESHLPPLLRRFEVRRITVHG